VVTAALTLGIALLVLLVSFADGRALLERAAVLRPSSLLVPMLLALLSYAAMARSYQGIADAAGARLPFRTWLRITFVSSTVNYLVTSAGLSGFAARMLLLSQHGIPSGRAVLVSLVQQVLTNFTILLFVLAGFATLVVRNQLGGLALGVCAALVVLFAAILSFTVLLVYHRRLRRLTLLFLANTAHRVLRRVAPRLTPRRVRLWRLQHNLNEGLEFLLRRKDRMLAPGAWILLDWVLTMTIIWWAFRAVQSPVPFGLVMVGFGVGVFLSFVSLVPGGLGIMEGSMTAVFVSLGAPFEAAVVAVLIFRVAYYVLPLLMSVFFFHGLVRQATSGTAAASRV
jgi:hypothetical protein